MESAEYKKVSAEFLSIASKMLRSTDEVKNVYLVRFRKFIEENSLIADIINRKIEGVVCEEGIIRSTNGFWLTTRIPYDEAEHIRGIYDHLIEMTENPCDLLGIAFKFPLSSKRCDDKIQNYLEKVFKPLVDFVVNELRKGVIDVEKVEKGGMTITIEKNMGTINNAQGDIQSINIINGTMDNEEKIKELIEKLTDMLQDTELDDELKEEVLDDLDTISEQVQQESPKESKIRTAYKRIKQFIGKIPAGVTNATAIASGMNSLIEEIGKILTQLK